MFGFGRRRKKREFEELLRAAAEGQSRSEINRYLSYIGVAETESDNARCSEGAVKSLLLTLKHIDKTNDAELEDYLDGICLMTFSNHLSYWKEANFEIASALALMTYFQNDENKVAQAIHDYNQMQVDQPKVIMAIGETFAKWTSEPSPEHLQRLALLLKTLRSGGFQP